MLVAVTVTDPAVAGAVNSPAVLIAPAAADQATVELKLPVPCTVALHCDVACAATEEGVHETETDEMEEEGGGWLLLAPPPQAEANSSGTAARRRYRSRRFTDEGLGVTEYEPADRCSRLG
jgi:hypothetical protein